MARDDLGYGDDGFLERRCTIIGMAVDLHTDKNCEVEADLVTPQYSPIAFDVTIALQTIDPSETR